eukprot:8129185-Pyramimonas_sp.AAC.1
MAISGSLALHTEGGGVHEVTWHALVGIKVDSDLTFVPYSRDVLAKGRAAFDELFQACDVRVSHILSWPHRTRCAWNW